MQESLGEDNQAISDVLADVYDTEMSYESSIQITKLINQGRSKNYEHAWLCKSNLFETLVPRVYSDPDLIQTFVKIYNVKLILSFHR
jgi:hypothetical protein